MVEKHRIDSQEITISDKVDAFVIYEFKYYVEKSHAKVFMRIFPIPIFSTNRFWSTKNYHFQQTRSFHPLYIYINIYIFSPTQSDYRVRFPGSVPSEQR